MCQTITRKSSSTQCHSPFPLIQVYSSCSNGVTASGRGAEVFSLNNQPWNVLPAAVQQMSLSISHIDQVEWERLDKEKFARNGACVFGGVMMLLFPLQVIKTRTMVQENTGGGARAAVQVVITLFSIMPSMPSRERTFQGIPSSLFPFGLNDNDLYHVLAAERKSAGKGWWPPSPLPGIQHRPCRVRSIPSQSPLPGGKLNI